MEEKGFLIFILVLSFSLVGAVTGLAIGTDRENNRIYQNCLKEYGSTTYVEANRLCKEMTK